ncbi:peptide chain release factor H [Elizabethkingia meningoseptica]|uniref:peptide chain release factor H n=1 Tax=Elizabethkingia meningoseptica TaxID=238 RepID=UPI000332CD1C|nr:peptide chain release factor H [Elizabethkingia meningoseptica]AQX04506.1 peptide chain release factor H [Elizabethkingia meningoseptica]AQX46547.1 peptide chain release factor H [Elizabethkingia meningoseptica]EOR31493.1 peptide chain release factor-like protein [Elizabethkingia meningoseptica ATCC 13253 = NBRC 12535]KUY19062.1 peptide chain release factor H [Elizabethkingia meningoseptica]MDE5490191.1 peptide chain release factor H [Elizabethkingia meningoseptica]
MEKIIQITSGRGPLECQWVVAKILKVFLEEAKQNKIEYEILHREKGDENLTLKSISILLKGKEPDLFLKGWLGSICWQGKSTFRKLHKRSNWFVGVFELEGMEQICFNEKEIRFQTTRSQGSGGQNVNKVNTAVRATYIPTGQSVFVQDSRSQLENKKLSVERLKEKVMTQHIQQLERKMQETWNNHLQVQRGNPVRTYSGTDFKKNYQDKSFKKQRNILKNELKNYTNELN